MKVLLTGASGFLGSHVLDQLRARAIETAVLLRPTSDKGFIQQHLPAVEVRTGSITALDTLSPALKGITHVIHCAGLTRARKTEEFYDINQTGTRNLLEALGPKSQVERFVHISSLAAVGPGTPDQPARDDTSPRPVSEYGSSKLAAEVAVLDHCRVPFVIVRPPAVYGPRDYAFLSMFKAIQRHVLPRPATGQALSLVFVRDLAEAIVKCLDHQAVVGKAFLVASRDFTSGRAMAEEIMKQMKRWTLPLPLPVPVLWLACVFEQAMSNLTGRPALLNLQKFAELRAPGWVCDPSRFEKETGHVCRTGLGQGISETLAWYEQNGCL